jgi:cysteinyl-tRNA synthetase
MNKEERDPAALSTGTAERSGLARRDARTALRLFNTRSGEIEAFVPVAPPEIAMYVCGATVYAPAHIGHGRSYVVFDVLRRHLEHQGYAVRHVQNFTDVAEEISIRAREAGRDPMEFAEGFIQDFLREMDRLGVKRADAYPRVSEYIPAIIESIGRLVERGYAYSADDGMYFDAQRAGGFGDLSHQKLEDMIAGGVGGTGARKHLLDFALWKRAKPTELAWDSPWGPGRPGWHIECTVMSGKLLPRPLDIHGGGIDLIYPHHESEILTARAETGIELSRFYVHNALVTHRLQKMSKSRANFVTLAEVFEEYPPEAVRYALLTHHYRAPMECCDEGFDDAVSAVETLARAAKRVAGGGVRDSNDSDMASPRAAFWAAMNDDLDTPRALAVVMGAAADVGGKAPLGDVARRETALLFHEAAEVLGLPSLLAA